jgi:hypothetical protein
MGESRKSRRFSLVVSPSPPKSQHHTSIERPTEKRHSPKNVKKKRIPKWAMTGSRKKAMKTRGQKQANLFGRGVAKQKSSKKASLVDNKTLLFCFPLLGLYFTTPLQSSPLTFKNPHTCGRGVAAF